MPALSSCGGNLGGTRDSAPNAGPVEKSVLSVGTMPIVGAAPLGLAAREQFFHDQRLSVRPIKIRSGAVSVPALLRGELDVTFGNYVSFIAEQARGADIKIIAEASRAATGNFAICVLPSSDIQTIDDLRDQQIGVNARDNIATLLTNTVLTRHGITSGDIEYVEIGFPDMIAALQRGEVEAAFLPEPFLTQAKINLGVRTILDPCEGQNEGIPIDGYAVTAEFAAKHPKTVRAFQRGLRMAQYACADPNKLIPELVKTTKVDQGIASLVSPSVYPISVEAQAIQRVAELMRQAGTLGQTTDVTAMTLESRTR